MPPTPIFEPKIWFFGPYTLFLGPETCLDRLGLPKRSRFVGSKPILALPDAQTDQNLFRKSKKFLEIRENIGKSTKKSGEIPAIQVLGAFQGNSGYSGRFRKIPENLGKSRKIPENSGQSRHEVKLKRTNSNLTRRYSGKLGRRIRSPRE